MGARTFNVATKEELCQALRQARQESRTCVIVVRTARDATSPPSELFWDFMVAEVSNDPLTVELRKRYDEERRLQRFHY
jgi:TPP-dependent trihydroxycyclohexane-1,2-dione (THcHDO) dehydratase